MLQEMGREPTPEELAIRMDMPEDKIRKVLKISKEPISMETPIGDDEDSHLGDFIEDATMQSPIDRATGEGLKESTKSVLSGLTAREAKVLRMRFGIDMNTDHPLKRWVSSSTLPVSVFVRSKPRLCASCAILPAPITCVVSWTSKLLAQFTN